MKLATTRRQLSPKWHSIKVPRGAGHMQLVANVDMLAVVSDDDYVPSPKRASIFHAGMQWTDLSRPRFLLVRSMGLPGIIWVTFYPPPKPATKLQRAHSEGFLAGIRSQQDDDDDAPDSTRECVGDSDDD